MKPIKVTNSYDSSEAHDYNKIQTESVSRIIGTHYLPTHSQDRTERRAIATSGTTGVEAPGAHREAMNAILSKH